MMSFLQLLMANKATLMPGKDRTWPEHTKTCLEIRCGQNLFFKYNIVQAH
jgi:hypothetical protein